jgi:ADP-heptose:LPS heptosyltransferase
MPEHALVVRADNAGDVLLAGPAVRAVAARARVTMLCGPHGASAGRMLPGVQHVITHELPWIDPTPTPVEGARILALAARIRELDIQRALVFTSFHQSPLPTALVLRLSGVPFIGAICEDYPGSLLDIRHRVSEDIHEVQRALSLAAVCGYELPPDDEDALKVENVEPSLLAGWEPYLVVHPGASVPARRWDPKRSRELVDALVQRGHRVAVTGTTGEIDLVSDVAGDPRPQVVNLAGQTSLAELAGIIASADVTIVGNTAPAHLSAAVGTAVVSLYPPTVPAVRWHPWRVPHLLLGRQDVPCAGCRARDCPVSGHPCLSSIVVRDVVSAVERLMADRAGNGLAGAAS